MFGLGKKKVSSDKLGVQVHAVADAELFALAVKIWNENLRSLHIDNQTHKEFLHFGYANPKCVIWLQRDQGRNDMFELIVRWEADKTYEVCTIGSGTSRSTGNAARAKALLNSMLTTPSVVLSTDY